MTMIEDNAVEKLDGIIQSRNHSKTTEQSEPKPSESNEKKTAAINRKAPQQAVKLTRSKANPIGKNS